MAGGPVSKSKNKNGPPSGGPPDEPSGSPKTDGAPQHATLLWIGLALLAVIAIVLIAILLRCGCFAGPAPPPAVPPLASGGSVIINAPLVQTAPPAGSPAPGSVAASAQAIIAAWAQVVPKDATCVELACETRVLVRAIVPPAVSCDWLARDAKANQPLALRKRDNPRPDRFPIVVCEGLLELDDQGVNFADGTAIRWTGAASGPNAIAIIGDTGCSEGQNCNLLTNWPLAQVAAQAGWPKTWRPDLPDQPDLVIHVGDYRYRGGDDWPNWHRDFFEPARMLLLAAPWVMARGNHENCYKEDGVGWAFLLSPTVGHVPQCHDSASYDRALIEPSIAVDFKTLRLVVVDSADSKYRCESWRDIFRVQEQARLDKLTDRGEGARGLWLVTHYPLLNILSTEPCPNTKDRYGSTAAYHDVLVPTELGKRVDAFVSGDLHSLQLVQTPPGASDAARLVQFVAGNGGTHLDKAEDAKTGFGSACNIDPAHPKDLVCADITLGKAQGYANELKVSAYLRFVFGFMTAERTAEANRWVFRSRTFPASGTELWCEVPATATTKCGFEPTP